MADEPNTTGTLVSPEPGKGTQEPVPPEPGSATAPTPGETGATEKVVAGPWIRDDGSFISDWTNHLPDDVKQEATQMKLGERVKSVSDLARATVTANRQLGKKGVILPTEKSTPEEISEYRKAVGVPETIEGYQVRPETIPDGLEWKDEDARPFLEIAHKHHASPALMRELVSAHISRQAQLAERMNDSQTALLQKKYDEGIQNLNQAWGKKFETNKLQVQRALAAVGCPTDDPGLLSPNVVKAILNLSNMVSDERIVSAAGGGSAFAQVDPGQLAHAIVNDPDNPDHDKYRKGDPQTTAKVEALFREASRLKDRR